MIVHPDVENYLKELAPVPHPVLEEMEKLGNEQKFPIVGPLVGRFLVSLIQFGHVHTVLECGSGFGYSALWMATALSENAKITCIEYDAKNIELGKEFFQKADLSHKVTFVQGNALEIVPTFTQTYDLIINDVDKQQYPLLLPHLLSRLRVGGMLITDNVLWSGKVANSDADDTTKAIQDFNKMLIEDKGLWTSIIPLRDGLSLSIKLNV
jgi:predicted O-methyltransferase YrrM